MSVSRTEYVMCGMFLKDRPSDEWFEKYEEYFDPNQSDTLCIVDIDPMCGDKGYVIGHVLYEAEDYEGHALKEIITPIISLLRYEINDKLKLNCSLEDIKMYAFTCWN